MQIMEALCPLDEETNNNSKYLLITYYVSGTVLSSLHVNTHNSSMKIISILQKRNLGHQEV